MYEEKQTAPREASSFKCIDLTEELFLDLDPDQDGQAVWEWNGRAWVPMAD